MLFPDSGSSASAASAQAVRCSLGTRLLGYLAALGVVSRVAILQYQPEERLVDTLGFPQVKHRLQAVLSRTRNPRIIALDITESDLRYRTPTSGHLMGFQDGQSSVEIRLMFARVERIDVYQSHVVFVRDKDDKDLAHLAFATEQDAKMFADLLMSLRAVQLRHPPRQGWPFNNVGNKGKPSAAQGCMPEVPALQWRLHRCGWRGRRDGPAHGNTSTEV